MFIVISLNPLKLPSVAAIHPECRCGHAGCEITKLIKGYCAKHYQRFIKYGDTGIVRQAGVHARVMVPCSCGKGRFWPNRATQCRMCYQRDRRKVLAISSVVERSPVKGMVLGSKPRSPASLVSGNWVGTSAQVAESIPSSADRAVEHPAVFVSAKDRDTPDHTTSPAICNSGIS